MIDTVREAKTTARLEQTTENKAEQSRFKLVADGAELIERAADLVLIVDDHFKAAALRVNDTKAVLAEEVSGIGNAVGLVLIGSAAGVDVAFAENGSEGILDEAAAVQLADLAVEYLAGSGSSWRR